MAKFFKFVFASCLGTIIALSLMVLISFGVMGSVANMQKPSISANSVLHLKLDKFLPELSDNAEATQFPPERVLGLNDLYDVLDKAADDDKIKGIFLETETLPAGYANTAELHQQFLDFRKSGKFIVSYGRYLEQSAYHLASAADEIIVHPVGMVDVRGYAAQIPFFKEMLDKVGVKMEVFYAGKFKSATEPYRRNDMSPEAKEQVREYLNDIYENFLSDVSLARRISLSEMKNITSTYEGNAPNEAVALQLIDHVGFRQDALTSIRKRIGLEDDKKVHLVSAVKYREANPRKSTFTSSNRIAVVYAEGTIVDGKGSVGQVADQPYVELFKKLADNDKVKAMVLRVNSPGGSAMASESMHNALQAFKETGKPVVVSMGNYAASGGYYIACPADSIFAEENTLTGSIGVFNMFPQAMEMLEEKLGIHFDSVSTTPVSAGLTPWFTMTDAEKTFMQNRTDNLYQLFLKRVADGRNMTVDQVHEIAQGRVWTGQKATTIGLVDAIGNVDNAIHSAAKLAKLDDYKVKAYPHIKEPFQRLIEELSGGELDAKVENILLKQQLGEHYDTYKSIQDLTSIEGPQARLPFILQ